MLKRCAFLSVAQAMMYFNTKNPARARSVNPHEPERGNRPDNNHFSGDHPDDIYASVAHAIKATLLQYPDPLGHRIFKLYCIGPRDGRLSKESIEYVEQIYVKRVLKILRELSDELEAELVRRELMPDPELYDRNCH